MDSELDSLTWPGLRETYPPVWSSDLYALCLQNSQLPHNSHGLVSHIDTILDDPIDFGLDVVEQSFASEPSDTIDDRRDDSLAPGGAEHELDTVPKITEHNKSSSILPVCTVGKGSKTRRSKNTWKAGEDGEDQKRTKRLERNRIAAKKCRRKRSEQMASLREKEAALEMVNMRMRLECTQIKDEVNKLKVFVMMHALQSKPNDTGNVAEQAVRTLD